MTDKNNKSARTGASKRKGKILIIVLVVLAIAGFAVRMTARIQVAPSNTFREAVALSQSDGNDYHIINTYEKLVSSYPELDIDSESKLIYYNSLDAYEKELYRSIYYSSVNCDMLVGKVPDGYYQNPDAYDLNEIFTNAQIAFHFDHPEIYWAGSLQQPEFFSNYYYCDFHFYFSDLAKGYSKEEYDAFVSQRAAFDSKLDSVVGKIKKRCGNSDDWHSALTAYKWICDNVDYDKDVADKVGNYKKGDGNENKIMLGGGIYSAVTDGSCVCRGYSELYKVIMNALGVECSTISGRVSGLEGALGSVIDEDDSSTANHEWNIVRISGDYCNVDVTNAKTDDSDIEYNMAYFCTDDDTISSTHTRMNQFDQPDCNTDKHSFFHHEKLYMDTLDSDDLDYAVKYAIKNGYNAAVLQYKSAAVAKSAQTRFAANSRTVQNVLLKYNRDYDDKINIDEIGYYYTAVDDQSSTFYICLSCEK